MQFSYAGNNRSRDSLQNLAGNDVNRLSAPQRRTLRAAIPRLQSARVEADYVASATVDRVTALDALRYVERVLLILEPEE